MKHHGMTMMSVLKACAAKQDMTGESNRFGRLLPASTRIPPDQTVLNALAEAMRPSGKDTTDAKIPAGMTFFGQFIDHDITLDASTSLDRAADPSVVDNLRTPRLELDSCYGDGPEGTPYFYDQAAEPHGQFLIGNDRALELTVNGHPHSCKPNPLDFQRNSQGRALIGDPRNDENALVAQFHLQILLFHNAVLRMVAGKQLETHRKQHRLPDGTLSPENDFEFARRLVRWHYQWLVNYQFLSAFVAEPVLARCWERARDGVSKVGSVDFARAVMPVEFSVAAFRFAHSTVLSQYRMNGSLTVNLFSNSPAEPGLGAFRPIAVEERPDWRNFFPLGGSTPQAAGRLDTEMAAELFDLPFAQPASLALRNLVRGAQTFNLPSGEAVALAMGFKPLAQHDKCKQAKVPEGETPLWFYCLAEAEANGGKLGEVGGTIVGMVLMRMQRNDPEAYLCADERWVPIFGPGKGLPEERFTFSDMMEITAKEAERHDKPQPVPA